jgi:hypothetical protein
LTKKETKKVKEKRMLRLFSWPTHKDTENLNLFYRYCNDSARPCCVSSGDTGGTAFSPGLLIEVSALWKAKKRCWKYFLKAGFGQLSAST